MKKKHQKTKQERLKNTINMTENSAKKMDAKFDHPSKVHLLILIVSQICLTIKNLWVHKIIFSCFPENKKIKQT